MTLSNTADTACAKVLNVMTSDVSSGIIQLDTIPAKFNPLSAFPEESCIWCYHNDDNAFYCPFDPTIGTVNIANFYANHSEGGSTRAIGKYSHAEGRQTIADIRYSHAEGSHCFAGGMAAHCEGFGTPTSLNTANGQASHCEGMQNKAFGIASHAAGYKSCANDDVSYVWSGISSATTSSHGEGTYTVDPKNGVNGFYIGNMSLGQLVDGCMDVIKVYSATSADVVNSTGTLSANSIKSAVQKAGSAHVLQLQNDVSVDFS